MTLMGTIGPKGILLIKLGHTNLISVSGPHASLHWRIKMLVFVQVCVGIKVFCEHGVLDVNSESTIGEVFHRISTGQVESPDGFRLPEQYADSPVSCSITSTPSGKFQSIPRSIKVQDAVEFGRC